MRGPHVVILNQRLMSVAHIVSGRLTSSIGKKRYRQQVSRERSWASMSGEFFLFPAPGHRLGFPA
jgi:hypothetical protein